MFQGLYVNCPNDSDSTIQKAFDEMAANKAARSANYRLWWLDIHTQL
jgi:hypothetical protein